MTLPLCNLITPLITIIIRADDTNSQSNQRVMSSIDKGYAWIIPFACFFIQAVLFGTYRSYSLMYKVLLDKFGIARSDASWPFSLCMTVVHLTGPISGCLNQYFSVRAIT